MNILQERKESGAWQTELESLSGYSKSHLSETLKVLESNKQIVRKKEGNLLLHVWSSDFFPGHQEDLFRVGILRSTEYIPYLLSLTGILSQRGIKLRIRVFDSSIDILKSLLLGSLEVALAPFLTQLIYASLNPQVRFLHAIASGGSAIYQNRISTSRVCMGSEISTMSLLIKKFLTHNEEIQYLPYRSPREGIRSIVEGRAGYVALWEPYCQILSKEENISPILQYGDMLGETPCCIASTTTESREIHGQILEEARQEYSSIEVNKIPSLTDFNKFSEMLFGDVEMEDVKKSLSSYHFSPDLTEEDILQVSEEAGLMIPRHRIISWLKK